MKKTYNARWYSTVTLQTVADVSIVASSDAHAKLLADKVSLEIGIRNCRRSIYQAGRQVE
jgi:hypothetical protein